MGFLISSDPPPTVRRTLSTFAGLNQNENRAENEYKDCKNMATDELPAAVVRGQMQEVFPFTPWKNRILKYVRTHDSVVRFNINPEGKAGFVHEFLLNGDEEVYSIDQKCIQLFTTETIPVKYKDAVCVAYYDARDDQAILSVLSKTDDSVQNFVICDKLEQGGTCFLVPFGNRLLCAVGEEIFISYEDDISKWDQFYVEGAPQGSYDINEAACQQISMRTGGNFTGCAYYKDKPVLFKARAMYALYGSYTPFSLVKIADVGCVSADSVQLVGDDLLFLSEEGAMLYNGGAPYCVSQALPSLGRSSVHGCAATNRFYFIDRYVYDLRFKCWSCLDERFQPVLAFRDRVFFYDPEAQRLLEMRGDLVPNGERVEWSFTTGRFHESTAQPKLYTGVELQVEPLEDAELRVEVSQNGAPFALSYSETLWRGRGRRIPLHFKPCDSFQLRVSGRGRVRIPFLSRVYRTVDYGV